MTPDCNCHRLGGELLDRRAFRALCPDDPAAAAALCEHPYDDRPVCAGAGNSAVCDGTTAGSLTFAADGTVAIETELTLVSTWTFTDECPAWTTTTATSRGPSP